MREEGTPRPSPRAVQRLAADVGGEVVDLRAALRSALAAADRHESEGRPDRAAAVLAEQQQLLAVVHRRLEDRLAEAAVEREAERVVDAVAPERSAPLDGAPAAVAEVADRNAGMALRLLASAAATFVGAALLLTPGGGGMLAAADSARVEEGVSSDGEGVEPGSPEPDAAVRRPEPSPVRSNAPPPSPVGEPAGPGAQDPVTRPPSDDPDADQERAAADRLQSELVDPRPVRDVLDRLDHVPAVTSDTDPGDDSDSHDPGTSDDADAGEDDAEQPEPSERPWQPRDLAREDDENADPER